MIIKTLARVILMIAITLAVYIGWQHGQIQTVQAIEIQPGSPWAPAPDQGPDSSEENRPTSEIPAQAGLQAADADLAGANQPPANGEMPSLDEFIATLTDGQAGAVRGLYVPGLIALRIVQQPDGQVDFISSELDTATQYQSPAPSGVIGLLAHNFLSGASFFQILPDQVLTIVYGDGQTEGFRVVEIRDYQRLTELDMHSAFVDLDHQQTLSADQVYQQYYGGERHLTLQTCLERNGNWNWGIRMITAYPVLSTP